MPRIMSGGAIAVVMLVSAGCGGRAPLRVSPSEIPMLEERLADRPDDASARLRYAAALFADGRCSEARLEAENAAALQPDNGVTPLIQGQCFEAAGRLAEAVEVYSGYLRQYADADGAEAVRGRQILAERALADVRAREALSREAEISARPAEPGVFAVIPVAVVGDDSHRFTPLSRALAQMLISDLGSIDRIRMVERLEIQALIDELGLVAANRVDPSTAARVGRLVRAEDLVQGTLVVEDGSDDPSLRLEASLVGAAGRRSEAEPVDGALADLLDMEKRLALSVADRIAGPLTPAEERRILDNGPGNVQSLLRWADGLILEERGDYAAAAAAYSAAQRADPGFADAARRARRSAAAAAVIGRPPSEVVAVGRAAAEAAAEVSYPGVPAALSAAVLDVAPLASEIAVGLGPGATAALTPGSTQPSPVIPVDVLLRILVRIPR